MVADLLVPWIVFESEPNDVYESNAMIQVRLQPQVQPLLESRHSNTGLDIAATILVYLNTLIFNPPATDTCVANLSLNDLLHVVFSTL